MDRAELQAVQLASALVLGLVLGLFYDVYRVWFRTEKKHISRGLGDVLWWLAALLMVAAALYHINGLQLRAAPLMLVAGGVVLQQGVISPWTFPMLQRLVWLLVRTVRLLIRIMHRVLAIALLPLLWVVELLFRLTMLVHRLIRRLWGVICRLLAWMTAPITKPLRLLVSRLRGALKRRIKRWLGRWLSSSSPAEETAAEMLNHTDN